MKSRDGMNRFSGLLLTCAVFLASLALPRAASAIQLDVDCGLAADILLSGDQELQLNVVGQTSGTAGMLANLLCFVGDRRCSCMRNLTETDSGLSIQYAREVGALIAGCSFSDPGRRLSGVSQEAATNVCR